MGMRPFHQSSMRAPICTSRTRNGNAGGVGVSGFGTFHLQGDGAAIWTICRAAPGFVQVHRPVRSATAMLVDGGVGMSGLSPGLDDTFPALGRQPR